MARVGAIRMSWLAFGIRHSKIQTTLDLYTQEDSDETRAAQGEFLSAVGMNATIQ